MSGSALDVMCALFLPQWPELKAHEKPIQSLLSAGLRLVTTAWACRRSPSPRTRAVSLFQPLKEEHPAVEDKTVKSPWHLTASTRVLSSARRMGRDRVWRSTDGADGPKQEHDADPSDGLSAKASVVSRAIRPCLRQGCRRPCVAHAQQTAIWRPSGGRSAGWRRSTGWCGARTAGRLLERAVQRFAGVSHPPPLHAHSRGCRIGRCSLCHSVLWTTAAARGAGCSTTRLQDFIEWCVAIGLLHDQREERSDDVPTGVVV